jgi:hypothetical protein
LHQKLVKLLELAGESVNMLADSCIPSVEKPSTGLFDTQVVEYTKLVGVSLNFFGVGSGILTMLLGHSRWFVEAISREHQARRTMHRAFESLDDKC